MISAVTSLQVFLNFLPFDSIVYRNQIRYDMQKNQEKKEYTILQLMEVLSEKSDDSQLSEAFWAENRSANLLGRDCKKLAFYACLCAIAATPRPPVA